MGGLLRRQVVALETRVSRQISELTANLWRVSDRLSRLDGWVEGNRRRPVPAGVDAEASGLGPISGNVRGYPEGVPTVSCCHSVAYGHPQIPTSGIPAPSPRRGRLAVCALALRAGDDRLCWHWNQLGLRQPRLAQPQTVLQQELPCPAPLG